VTERAVATTVVCQHSVGNVRSVSWYARSGGSCPESSQWRAAMPDRIGGVTLLRCWCQLGNIVPDAATHLIAPRYSQCRCGTEVRATEWLALRIRADHIAPAGLTPASAGAHSSQQKRHHSIMSVSCRGNKPQLMWWPLLKLN
jgi:hypothetical protein